MKREEKLVALIAVATLILGISSASASTKPNPKAKSKISKTVVKAPAAKSPAAFKLSCSPTSATGHAPTKISGKFGPLPHQNKTFTLKTNCGDISFLADGINAPYTTFALTVLAQSGYYDDTVCHRLTTAGLYVLQCGDPTASGSGGPNIQWPFENFPQVSTNDYPEGTIAMAVGCKTNDGLLSSSQFFIVYKDTTLTPQVPPGCAGTPHGGDEIFYPILGKVIAGLDIVKAIAAKGVYGGRTDGAPLQQITINSVIVK